MLDLEAAAGTAAPNELPRELIERLPRHRKLRLAAEIVRAYGLVRWTLARRGLPATLTVIRARQPATEQSAEPRHAYARAIRLSWAVRRTLNLIPADSRCLMQALVLTTLLARRGTESDLLIGVQPGGMQPGQDFGAHAWVEYGGKPVPPGSEATYQPLARL